jgi:hypothetical protein
MKPNSDLEPIATSWRSYVAELPAWGIVAGAMAVSFWTQVIAVQAHGFAFWEALIWGTSTDAGTIACLFLAREGAHRGTPTWGAWVLSIACAVLSVQFNVVQAAARGDWLAVEGHVWMPSLALGVWWWLLHGRHRRWMSRPSADPADARPDMSGQVAEDRPSSGRMSARAEVRRLLGRRGGGLTVRQVMDETGISDRHARRLLSEERQPHVLAAGRPAATGHNADA